MIEIPVFTCPVEIAGIDTIEKILPAQYVDGECAGFKALLCRLVGRGKVSTKLKLSAKFTGKIKASIPKPLCAATSSRHVNLYAIAPADFYGIGHHIEQLNGRRGCVSGAGWRIDATDYKSIT